MSHDQLERVEAAMRDRAWHTLAELSETTGASEASVSARLRDLRKAKFGGHTIERQSVSKGLFRYRMPAKLTPPDPPARDVS